MRTGRRISTLIILPLMILGVYILPISARADEPGEEVIQELIRSDARAASTVQARAPYLAMCKMQENSKSGQLPAQGSSGASAKEKPGAPNDFSGGTIVAPRESTVWSIVAGFSSYCKLYELLGRGDIEVRKVGCVKSQALLGYNCDFIIQPKASEGEEATIIGQFFNPNSVFTSRFVPFGSKWYLALDTSPFVGAGFIRGAFSPR